MKQLPKIKILAVAIALQFVLLVGAGVALENKNEQRITMAGLYTSISQTKMATLLSNIDSNDHVGQVSGSIILNPRYGTDSNAGGLVTCNRGYHIGDKASCGPCELLATIQRVLRFLILVSTLLASIMFTYAGFLYLTSSTNPGNIAKAKGIFWNVLFGFVAVLGAWIVINTVLNTLYGRPLTAVSQIACEYDRRDPSYLPNPDAGQSVGAGKAAELRAQITSLDRQIAELNKKLSDCNAESENLADRNICRAEIQNKIDQLEQERDGVTNSYNDVVNDELLKVKNERLAELGREHALRGCSNVVEGEALYARCLEIRNEMDSLRAEIAAIPPASTDPVNKPIGTGQATMDMLNTPTSRSAVGGYMSEQKLSEGDAIQEAYVRQELTRQGVVINNEPCGSGMTTGCTDVRGLTNKTLTYIAQLQNSPQCADTFTKKCGLTITGGSEGGHAPGTCSHGSGCKFDLSSEKQIITNVITQDKTNTFVRDDSKGFDGNPTYIDKKTGAIFVLEKDHWDVQVPQ